MKPAHVAASLSAQIRARTAPLHEQAERLLGLPGAIRTRSDYIAWLSRFLGLYEPLEQSLVAFHEWDEFGFTLPSPRHCANLAGDVAALGVNPGDVPRAPPESLPDLSTFAHALGALYVLECATRGGIMIRRDLDARIGAEIAGATRFFGGRGDATVPVWRRFQAALDRFGYDRSWLRVDVICGAELCFLAMLAWFGPFRTDGTGPPA